MKDKIDVGSCTATEMQDLVYQYITDYWRINIRSPSFRDISRDMEISSTSIVAAIVKKLQKRGKLLNNNVKGAANVRQLVPPWVEHSIRNHSDVAKTKTKTPSLS